MPEVTLSSTKKNVFRYHLNFVCLYITPGLAEKCTLRIPVASHPSL